MIVISCPAIVGRHIQITAAYTTSVDAKERISNEWGLGQDDAYLLYNGRKLQDGTVITCGSIQAVPRLAGGKGGFGSMLRAIGAQIEKTTNREACRDLSGRRLRDINEEKRLKNWIAQQADREREAAERKRKKLERLRAEPKHDFKDTSYEEERSVLTEKVSDAVEQGFKMASSSSTGISHKRKVPCTATSTTKKKKTCLWLDPDEEDLSSLDSDDSEDGAEKPSTSTSKMEASGVLTPSTSSENSSENSLQKETN